MIKVISVLLFVCFFGSSVIDACSKKPTPSCTFEKCVGASYAGWPRNNYNNIEANGCIKEKNAVRHRYGTERRNQRQCPGKQFCNQRDMYRTKCRCRITTVRDTTWSEWHEDKSGGGCSMKRVMNQEFDFSFAIRDNSCPPDAKVQPKMERKSC